MNVTPSIESPRPFFQAGKPGILICILAAVCLPASATAVYTFEDLPDAYFYSSGDQNIGTYYPDITFGPNVTGLSVSRLGGYDSSGFPPESGDVAIWDASDPTITIEFDSPLNFFGIWYDSFDPLTLQVFDSSDNLIDTVIGNPDTDGTTGTPTFLSISDTGIQGVTLTSTPGFFVVDDMTIGAGSASVPESNPMLLFSTGLGLLFFSLRRGRKTEVALFATIILVGTGNNLADAADVPLGGISDGITPFFVPYAISFSTLNWSAGIVNGSAWDGYLAFYSDPGGTNLIATSSTISLPRYGCDGDCGSLSFPSVISFAANTTYYGKFTKTFGFVDQSPSFVIGLHPSGGGYDTNSAPYSRNSVFYDPGAIGNIPSASYGKPSATGFASEPINTATGNYIASHIDLSVPGKGLPVCSATIKSPGPKK